MRLKSMYALRIGELIGSVRSRMSTILTARSDRRDEPVLAHADALDEESPSLLGLAYTTTCAPGTSSERSPGSLRRMGTPSARRPSARRPCR
jgi:hypothetical protein